MRGQLFLLLVLFAFSITSFGQAKDDVFHCLRSKNFFKARDLYQHTKENYVAWEQQFIEATLANAFNKTEQSNEFIAKLLAIKQQLPDSIAVELYSLQTDNYSKQALYKEAATSIDFLLQHYKHALTDKLIDDLSNQYKIWNALKDEPQQSVQKPATSKQILKIDNAGLKNLSVTYQQEQIDFIFDTGANISTVTVSTAKRLNMKIIPAGIEVGSITGQTITSDLAICPLFYIGDIEIRHAIFLVLPDEALYIQPIDYRMNGIIGFPIMNALGEIQITKDNQFIIPADETKIQYPSNMALKGLTPLIHMDDMHFSFDSGATESMLYKVFYDENKASIEGKYQQKEFSFGGAAGKKNFPGYPITYTFHILDKTAELQNLALLIERVKEDETVYGNIGQDLIQQFDKMTLNFNHMFIQFE